MNNMRKDILGAVAVGVLAVVLFTTFMTSMVMLGQSAGRAVIGAVPSRAQTPADTTQNAAPAPASAAPDTSLFGKRMPGPYDGVPILCYHYLRGATSPVRVARVFLYVVLSLPVLDDDDLWTISEGTFEKQMRYLHENGYRTITIADLTRWQYGHEAIPKKSVIITFDDGDRSVYDYAYPILKRYGFRATYFIITGHVGTQWNGIDFLTWDELREMKESGVFEIASHTHDLHFKTGKRDAESPVFISASRGDYAFNGFESWEDAVRADLTRSRDEILGNVGSSCRYLAWPYGHGNDAVDRVAAEAGFDRILLLRDGLNPGFVPAHGDTLSPLARMRATRFAVSARTSMRAFRNMLSGEYTTALGY